MKNDRKTTVKPFDRDLDVRTFHKPFRRGGWEILDREGDYCGSIVKICNQDGSVFCYDVEIEGPAVAPMWGCDSDDWLECEFRVRSPPLGCSPLRSSQRSVLRSPGADSVQAGCYGTARSAFAAAKAWIAEVTR